MTGCHIMLPLFVEGAAQRVKPSDLTAKHSLGFAQALQLNRGALECVAFVHRGPKRMPLEHRAQVAGSSVDGHSKHGTDASAHPLAQRELPGARSAWRLPARGSASGLRSAVG